MTVITNKTIQFDQLMKVFKKYVLIKRDSRPVLQQVYYDGKYLVATDSHQLLRVNADYVSDIPENLNYYDPKKLIMNDVIGNYPEVNRLIPDYSNSTVSINGNIKDFHNIIKEAKKAVKGNINNIIKLEVNKYNTIISEHNLDKAENEIYSNTLENVYTNDDEYIVHVNSSFLDSALAVVKKLSKLSYNDVEMNFISKMRPLHIKQNDVFDIVILPVRVY